MSRPTLGIMALYIHGKNLSKEELPFYKRLILEGRELDLDVFVFTPEDVNDGQKKVLALRYDAGKGRWFRQWSPLPSLVFDRCRFQRSRRFRQLSEFRQKYPDLSYLNRPLTHKWGSYLLLSKNGGIRPHLPETRLYRRPQDLLRFIRKYNLVYLKPNDGTGGRGIVSIKRLGDGTCLLQGRDRQRRIIVPVRLKAERIAARLRSWNLSNRYLIQQGIPVALPDGRVHDFRLLIQKNGAGQWEVTGIAGRIGAKRSVTSNLHGGGAAVPVMKLLGQRFGSPEKIHEILDTMERLSSEVVLYLEEHTGRLCEMALDIAVDPGGHCWLLEVNPKPAREVFRLIRQEDTYRKAIRRPLEFALWLAESRPADMFPQDD